jgi:hypothetical protein
MFPKTSQLGRGTLGSLILGYGSDVTPPAPVPNEWIVEAVPRVRWDGTVVEDPAHPRGEWRVSAIPHIEWEPFVTDPNIRWRVEPTPVVKWVTGPGVADSDCISGDGVIPLPDPEEAPASDEQNYVF